MRYWLGPWTLDQREAVPYWRPPDGAVSGMDLRTPGQLGLPGVGLFASANNVSIAATHMEVPDDPATRLSALDATQATLRLGQGDLSSLVWGDMLRNFFLAKSSPIDPLRPKPLRGTSRGELAIVLNGHYFWRVDRFTDEDPNWASVLAGERVTYAALRARVLQGALAAELHLKYLFNLTIKYGTQNYRQFQFDGQTQLPDETPVRPTTTLLDSFTVGSDTNLDAYTGPSGDWTELGTAGSAAVLNATDEATDQTTDATYRAARLEADLSTDDMLVSGRINTDPANANSNVAGVSARFNPSAWTNYCAGVQRISNGSRFHRVSKYSAGTETNLVNTSGVGVAPGTISVQIDGDQLSSTWDSDGGTDGSFGPTTDTSVTGYTRAGLWLRRVSGVVAIDDFSASDLAAPSAPAPALALLGVGT